MRDNVFPADAGVILSWIMKLIKQNSVPCGCRGDPIYSYGIDILFMCSLRMQG